MPAIPQVLLEFKRHLAEALIRSKLERANDVLALEAFLVDFRWEEGYTPGELLSKWRSLSDRSLPAGHSYSIRLHPAADWRQEIEFYAPVFKGRRIQAVEGRCEPEILACVGRHFELRLGGSAGGGASILGIGPGSTSRIFGKAVALRYEGPFAQDRPLYRLARQNQKQEMMRHILRRLDRSSRIDFDEFRADFGLDVREPFAIELRALAAFDQVRLDAKGISFTPARGPNRIFYALFFLAELVSESPFSLKRMDGSFIRRLKKEVAPLTLEGIAA